jgi:hypothetical protein
MKLVAIQSHRGLFYALFGLFEVLLWASAVMLKQVDPRRPSGLDNAVAVALLFSFFGLLIICWLLRRAAPRLAAVGLITALAGFAFGVFLPATS